MPGRLPNDSRVGAWLRTRRVELGMTQQDLLAAMGRSDLWLAHVSAIETGQRKVPLQEYETWARVLQIEPAEFAETVLRYINPWLYRMLRGFTPELRAELADEPHTVDRRVA